MTRKQDRISSHQTRSRPGKYDSGGEEWWVLSAKAKASNLCVSKWAAFGSTTLNPGTGFRGIENRGPLSPPALSAGKSPPSACWYPCNETEDVLLDCCRERLRLLRYILTLQVTLGCIFHQQILLQVEVVPATYVILAGGLASILLWESSASIYFHGPWRRPGPKLSGSHLIPGLACQARHTGRSAAQM